jgi:hypothetical protein
MTRHLFTAGALLLLLTTACARTGEVTGPDPASGWDITAAGSPLRTDSSVYHVRATERTYEVTIGVVFTNPTNRPVYIPTCHTPVPPVLQKQVGEWVTAYNPPMALCLGPPVVIRPRQSYDYTYRIAASRTGAFIPEWEASEVPGTYRLQWHMLRTWEPNGPRPGLGEPLPLELSTSAPFELRLQ